MPETVRDEIFSQRKRRQQFIAIDPAAEGDVHFPAQPVDVAPLRRFFDLPIEARVSFSDVKQRRPFLIGDRPAVAGYVRGLDDLGRWVCRQQSIVVGCREDKFQGLVNLIDLGLAFPGLPVQNLLQSVKVVHLTPRASHMSLLLFLYKSI